MQVQPLVGRGGTTIDPMISPVGFKDAIVRTTANPSFESFNLAKSSSRLPAGQILAVDFCTYS